MRSTALALDLGKIRHRAGRRANFVQQFQSVLAHAWFIVVDLDLVEERIDRRAQLGHRTHRSGEVFLVDGGGGLGLHLVDRFRERLLFDGEDVTRPLGPCKQVLAVVGVEELAERLDAADDQEQIVLAKVEASVAVMNEDFASAMSFMATLRPAVDAFFDKVKVNDDEPAVRENRLKLLNEIRAATRAVADFSKIEG